MEDEDIALADVICCQGPPRCSLQGEEAIAAQNAGCVWCSVITVLEDGAELHSGPSEA